MNFENCVESKNAVPVCNTPQSPSIKTYTEELEAILIDSIEAITTIIQFTTGDTPDMGARIDVKSLETATIKNLEMAKMLKMGIDVLGERLGVR